MSEPQRPTITTYRDGPLLVRGPFELLDQDGTVIDTARRTVALCRCGKSRTRPLCDGTHRLVHFRAPGTLESGPEDDGAGTGPSAQGAAPGLPGAQ
ncbi:MAG: CDGSH iron-sulfur domain-containing protein [Solirubrobacteraceae bacterium MAG38_C4-C5]|nr:CDGSH iron-sulfur domain-containing protein [Candidatus Siliceabacter maunaloa]